MDLVILVILILLNGVFAMSEMAIVASRKARLHQAAEEGHAGAVRALELSREPTHFLSTIQVGITLIGVLSGAYGERAIADDLERYFAGIVLFAPYAKEIALSVMVVGITYCALVVGELVPKQIALQRPEVIAAYIARPMTMLTKATFPIVKLLSLSTQLVLWLTRIRKHEEPAVTEEEIKVLIEQGMHAGVFKRIEHDMLRNVFLLDDRRVGTIMTLREEIQYLDLDDAYELNRQKIIESRHSRLPVCRGNLEHILGFVYAKEVLAHELTRKETHLAHLIKKAPYVRRSSTPMQLLEQFKKSSAHLAIVVDEYGRTAGLLTLTDLLETIVGNIPSAGEEVEIDIVQREDGSWLVDGLLDISRFKEYFKVSELPEENAGYHTLGGFIMVHLGKVPKVADHFEWDRFRFEVVDLDRNRVDRILVSLRSSGEENNSGGQAGALS